MKKIALTGGIASGKSTVMQFLQKLGIKVIYADVVSNQVLLANKAQIVTILGAEILGQNLQLDKAKIRECIFTKSRKKQQLENFLHPIIRAEINRKIKLLNTSVVVEVPLLFEAGWQDDFDVVWLVTTTQQKYRLLARDNINHDLATKMINSQIQYYNLADEIIDNNSSVADLQTKIKALIVKYLDD